MLMKKALEPVTTDPKGEDRWVSVNTSALATKTRSMKIRSYITGFIDGEGSFLISFTKRPQLKTGIEVRPSFTVSQHERSKEILQRIRVYFGCGTIRYNASDTTYKYEVRSLKDLCERIIPHFEEYPLQTSKSLDFDLFVQVCLRMQRLEHRSRAGIEEILAIAYTMNNLGARTHRYEDLLQIVCKMKV